MSEKGKILRGEKWFLMNRENDGTLKKVVSESEAYNELGYIYMMQQDYGKARRLFEMAISSSPTYFERASKNLEQLKLLVSRLTRTGTKNRNSPASESSPANTNTNTEMKDSSDMSKNSVSQ